MTTSRMYRCNLCGMPIEANDGRALGIYFAVNAILLKAIREVENHICAKCADQLPSIINVHRENER